MEDFQDAAKRHLDDAELLFSQEPKRLANASHLFGVSAECALKVIERKLNPNVKIDRSKGKGHIPKLFDELCNVTLIGNADLISKINFLKENNFKKWDVGQRYETQTSFAIATVSAERDGAKSAHLLMTNFLSGVI